MQASVLLLVCLEAFTFAAASLQTRVSPVPIQAACYKAAAFRHPAQDSPTDKYLRISRRFTDGKRGIDRCPDGVTSATQELRHFAGIEYLTDIQINGQKVTVIFDTASSDTWLIEANYQCFGPAGQHEPRTFCNYLSPGGYMGNFSAQESIKDVLLNINYADGTWASGQFGFADVAVAGLTVKRQQIALADKSFWHGNNDSSGILGFAYPALTAAFVNGTRTHYTPIFTSLYQQGLSAPSFSIALRRDGIGYFAIGGLPPVQHGNNWASTPIVVTKIGTVYQYAYYSIIPEGFKYTNSTAVRQSGIYILDSGTTLSYLPKQLAAEFNKLFDPPAIKVESAYYVDCNAIPPDLSILISGIAFRWSPRDLVTRIGTYCMSGVQDATGIGLLGGVGQPSGMIGNSFLNSVVAVHDVGSAQMRFAAHIY